MESRTAVLDIPSWS